MKKLALSLLVLCLSTTAWADTYVKRYPNDTAVRVAPLSGTTTTNDCVKFDANGNIVDAGAACGSGSGGGNVGIGTINVVPVYVGISTLGPSNIVSVAGNVGINSTTPGQSLDVQGTARVSGHVTLEGVTSTGATGSGRLVFDNTPTLITPAIGAATGTSLALSGNIGVGGGGVATNPLQVTGDGNISGNLGVATTNPLARLHVQQTAASDALRIDDQAVDGTPFVVNQSGNLGISTTSPLEALHIVGLMKLVNSGSASAPSFYLNGDTTTGLYSSATNQWDFTTAGTRRMFLQANGNVGIGTTVTLSSAGLTVSGANVPLFVEGQDGGSGSTYGLAVFGRPTNTVGDGVGIDLELRDSNNARNEGAYIGTEMVTNTAGSVTADLVFDPQSVGARTERMRIKGNGNIGIGTTNPQSGLAITNGNVGIGTWSPAGLLMVRGGNVSIGTTNNTQLLVVGNGGTLFTIGTGGAVATAATSAYTASATNATFAMSGSNPNITGQATASGTTMTITGAQAADGGLLLKSTSRTGNGDAITFSYGNVGVGTVTNVMTAGNFGINSTAPGARLDVVGDVRNSGVIVNSGITSDAAHTDSTVCQDTTTHQYYSGSGTLGVCLGTSTKEAKENIAPLKPGLKEIMALKPISFKYRKGWGYDDKKLYYGFLAEDVETVLPKLVGKNEKGRVRSADYVGMIPVMVNGMQELNTKIDAIKKTRANDNQALWLWFGVIVAIGVGLRRKK